MNQTIETMKSKGKWHPESELKWLSKASIEEVERREENARSHDFFRLDRLYREGKIDFENPPDIWRMTFLRWMLARFGLKNTVSFLKTHDCENDFASVPGKLRAIGGVTEEEIEEALKEPAKINKSSVCRLANEMKSRNKDMSRKEAFIQAWKIVRNGGYETRVAGVSFCDRQEALRRLVGYDPKDIRAFLVPEFDNPYDANAVAVMVMVNGGKGVYRLGYVPKADTGIVKAFLGKIPELRIIDGDIKGAKLRLAA